LKLNVAVIYGGRSGEHEVSILSATSIMKALNRDRYNVIEYFISKEGKWSPGPILPEPFGNPGIDVVFPVLHGTFGEDGTMQGLFELADLPYVGAGVLASSTAMDKEIAKLLCRAAGQPVVEYILAGKDFDCGRNPFGYPVFVKPANMGSSVGVSKAKNCAELSAAVQTALQYDHKVLVERAIIGQEIECSVLGNRDPVASTPCEILPSRDFYDYDDKYVLNQNETRLPANVSKEKIEEIRRIAVECYRALQCEGMARVDFLLEQSTGKLYMNEVNTIPGFTSISMYPKMWEHDGLAYPKLLDRLIELALERQAARRVLRYTR
jgi:D-alanine--D-alanine ligase